MRISWSLWNALHQTDWRLLHFATFPLYLLALLATFSAYLQVRRTLALPKFAGFSRKYPRSAYKYLNNQYLARDLTTCTRASALTHHYRYLHATFGENFLKKILFGRATLWEEKVENHIYGVALGLSTPIDMEGELSLSFQADGDDIFILSFSVVPGWLPGLQTEHVLLIARLQGSKGCFEQIRMSTKALQETSPPLVLIAAVQGVATALGIRQLAGVSAAKQSSNGGLNPVDYETAYDAFWRSLGATRASPDFFHIPLPLPEKPIELIKRNHRSRTRAKRLFRKQISERVHQSFQSMQPSQN